MITRLLNAAALAAILAAGSAFAAKADVAASKPVAQHRVVSACTISIEKAENVLASSKVTAENIAMAWQHLDAAKQDRMSHQAKACKTESQTAANMLSGKV